MDESDVWEDVNARVPRSASRRAHIDIDAFLQMFERKVGRGGGLEAAEVAAVVAFLTMNVEEFMALGRGGGAIEASFFSFSFSALDLHSAVFLCFAF